MQVRAPRQLHAALRAVGVAVLLVLVSLWALSGGASARAGQEPCSAYPTPGSLAPAGTRVPAAVGARYAILRRPQRTSDELSVGQFGSSLGAARLIMSGTRFLGDTAYGGRVYLVPAQHLLSFRIAPPRCLRPYERSLEQELLPKLRKEYEHPALCLVIIDPTIDSPSCGAAFSDSEALLSTSGTPGFGLVPDGVSNVTVGYQTAPPRTVAVRHNFFAIVARRGAFPAPCGLQWLDPTGTVLKTVTGCSFISAETQALAGYKRYVSTMLATMQSHVASLILAVGSGSLPAAEAAWLPAHLSWLDLGQDDGAYGCFGEFGRQIDGTAAGLVGGTASPDFTGFHKIEWDLWTNHNLGAALTDAQQLQSFIGQLVATPLSSFLPATRNGLGAWVLRPHEIIEDANRDTLTGEDDYGSGTGLASLTADISADQEFLNVLAPVIDPLAPGLVGHARAQLATLNSAILATQVNGQWVAVTALPTSERAQVDADTGALTETLARIPSLITSTGNNAPAS